MEEMIGYCGYNCYLCAARSDDINVREKVVNAWKKYIRHENYNAENIACEGYKSKGNKIVDRKCKVRPCARNKGLDRCAQCEDFPCNKVNLLFSTPVAILTYNASKFKDITKEEFNFCVQQ